METPSIAAVTARLNGIVRNFPGITQRPAQPAFRDHGARVEAHLSFDEGPAGTAARLVTEHILRRRSTPVEPSGGASAGDGMHLSLSTAGASRFARGLGYAGTECLAPARPGRTLGGTTLPALLSHALIAFERDYGLAAADAPTLPVWSNVLRVFATDALTDQEFGRRAILSHRVVRVVLRDLAKHGWLESDPTRSRAWRLTDRGLAQERLAREPLAQVERRWRDRHGAATVESLRGGLADVAGRLDLEWPWYLTAYGPSDPSLTGGSFLPPEPGPPYVPGRGEEWPVAPRAAIPPPAELPLSALLSKVLAAFTVDYEEERLGPLGPASVFLTAVPGDAIALAQARSICDVGGTGKSAPERHLCVTVAPGRPRDGHRLVYLTPKARRIRDSYPALVMDIEARWRDRFGAGVFDAVRGALETLDAGTIPGTPDYPDTRAWLHPASLKARGATGRVADDGEPVSLAWHSGQSRPVD